MKGDWHPQKGAGAACMATKADSARAAWTGRPIAEVTLQATSCAGQHGSFEVPAGQLRPHTTRF